MRSIVSRQFLPHRFTSLVLRSFSSYEVEDGASKTVLVYHPPYVSRKELQEAVMSAVGEQSSRIVTPKDNETGEYRDHSYMIMSSPDVASDFCEKGAVFEGVTHVVRPNAESWAAERIGKTDQLFVNFPDEVSYEDAVKEAEQVAGEAALMQHRPMGNPNMVYLKFSSPEVVIKVISEGVMVNGMECFADYAAVRPERKYPDRPSQDQRSRALFGKTWTVSVRGLPSDTSVEKVKELVKQVSGRVPVRVNFTDLPNEQEVRIFFVEMQTPQLAQSLYETGMELEDGSRAELRLQEERRLNDSYFRDVYGQTTRLYLGGFESDTQVQGLFDALESQYGVKVTDPQITATFARFSVGTAEDAVKLYEGGLEVGDNAYKIRLLSPEITTPSSEVHIANLPFESTEEEVMDVVEQAIGIRPLKVNILTDRETNQSRGFGFAHFASPEQATLLVALPFLNVQGRDVTTKFSASRKRQGGAGGRRFDNRGPRKNSSSVLIAQEVTSDATAITDAIQQTYNTSAEVNVENGTAEITLESPEKASLIKEQGLIVDGLLCKLSFRRLILNSELAGSSKSLYVSQVTCEDGNEFMEEVKSQTGIQPVGINLPSEKNFFFLHFGSAEDAQAVAEKGLIVGNDRALVGYAKQRPQFSEGSGERRKRRYD